MLRALKQHLPTPAIAAIAREYEETVRRWLKRYRIEGRAGAQEQVADRWYPRRMT